MEGSGQHVRIPLKSHSLGVRLTPHSLILTPRIPRICTILYRVSLPTFITVKYTIYIALMEVGQYTTLNLTPRAGYTLRAMRTQYTTRSDFKLRFVCIPDILI